MLNDNLDIKNFFNDKAKIETNSSQESYGDHEFIVSKLTSALYIDDLVKKGWQILKISPYIIPKSEIEMISIFAHRDIPKEI